MEWKQLEYHEGQFYVNRMGEVKNMWTGRTLVGDVNNAGYFRVGMYHKGKQIRKFRHRIVAEAFIDNPKNLLQVNHIDGDKSNNTVDNLEWVDQSTNEKHAFQNGLKSSCKRNVLVIYNNGQEKTFESIADFSRSVGVSETTAHNWLNKRSATYQNRSIKCLTTIP